MIVSLCRTCRAPIRFVRTTAGAAMPLDVADRETGELVDLGDGPGHGRVVLAEPDAELFPDPNAEPLYRVAADDLSKLGDPMNDRRPDTHPLRWGFALFLVLPGWFLAVPATMSTGSWLAGVVIGFFASVAVVLVAGSAIALVQRNRG